MAGTRAETCEAGGGYLRSCWSLRVILCTWWSLFRTRSFTCGEVEKAQVSWAPSIQRSEWGPPGHQGDRPGPPGPACVPLPLLTVSPGPLPCPLRSHLSPLTQAGPGGIQRAPPQVPVWLTSSRLCSGTALKDQRLDSALHSRGHRFDPWSGN